MIRALIADIVGHDQVNFWLTNRIPRRLATRWIGWFSRIENPLVCAASLRVWRFFATIDLSDSAETDFRSMHQCFTRRLMAGARPVDMDPNLLVSPCDGIIGAAGTVTEGQVLQVKGMPYPLTDLLADEHHAQAFQGGCYVTLRLTSGMYHRFHAPHDLRVESVTHIFGDRWNVNPPTLRRVERVFCRNERATIRAKLASGQSITLVPVAAILVAGIRLNFLDLACTQPGAVQTHPCDAPLSKGDEMGWFEHGSTIIVLAPEGFTLCDHVRNGAAIRAGQPLLRLPSS